jgi:hypothetical protein
MIDYTQTYKTLSSPPNVMKAILAHPLNPSKKSIELGIFNSHRFAFYFWAKWSKEKKDKIVPHLVTFDWHQDLAYPEDTEKDWLGKLDLNNLFEVSFYSWAKLHPHNDNHIVSAAYLNLIGDIYVVCKQTHYGKVDDGVKQFKDIHGHVHHIRKFENHEMLIKYVETQNIEQIYFDIDLDYFTIENSTSNDKQYFTYMKDKDIKEVFNLNGPLMQWVTKRIEGMTIAFEPEHTGSINKSMKYFGLLEKLFFNGSVFQWKTTWRHLKR